MQKRLVLIGAAVLVVALLGVGITVGVNVANGTYGKAATLAASDLKLMREISAISAKLRKAPGVRNVTPAFRPLHLPDPTATIAIRMTQTASIANIEDIRNHIAAAASHYRFPADLLAITISDGLLTVWEQLRSSAAVPIIAVITDHPAPSAPALTITTASTSASDTAALVSAYPTALASSSGLSAGATWRIPGMEGTQTLPPTPILRILAAAATAHLAISQHAGTAASSGVYLDWTPGYHPLANLWIAYLSHSNRLADSAAHLTDASKLAHIVITSGVIGVIGVNFGYEGARDGALVRYVFFTGSCIGRLEPIPSESANLSQLGVTLDQLGGGAAGQCLPDR